jgi:type I restriction enzyme S subunit
MRRWPMSEAVSQKSGWTTVAFGDVVKKVTDKVDPEESDLERYVAGEHMDTDDLRIRRWGEIGDDYLGPAFHMRFKPGQVLYGSRRTYLRKVALADFEGITANTTYVLESKDPEILLPELLPFLMQAETFHEHSKRESKGSVNPYVNFSDLAWYEFALPPLEEQRRIAEVLTSFRRTSDSLVLLENQATRNFRVSLSAALKLETQRLPELKVVPAGWNIAKLSELTDPDRPVSYGILKPGDEDPHGVPMLRVQDFDDYGARSRTTISKVSREIADTSRTTYLEHGDVVVSIMATIGRAMLVTPSMSGWNVNRALAVLPAGSSVEGNFLEAYLQSSFVQRIFHISQIGGVQSRINLEFLKSLPVPVPPKDIRMKAVRLRNQLGASLEGIRQRRDVIRSMQNRFLEEISK